MGCKPGITEPGALSKLGIGSWGAPEHYLLFSGLCGCWKCGHEVKGSCLTGRIKVFLFEVCFLIVVLFLLLIFT